jgi:two-component system, chemotaxis family, sensor kinase CheA
MTDDPLKYFRVEARDIVERLSRGVLELEKGAPAAETVPGLLRLAHTIKGAARVVRQKEIADQAHAMEDALAALRDKDPTELRPALDTLLGLVEGMRARVLGLGVAEPPGAAKPVPTVEDVPQSLSTDVADIDDLIAGVAEAQLGLAGLRRSLGSLDRIRNLHGLLAEQLRTESPRRSQTATSSTTSAVGQELGSSLTSLQMALSQAVEQTERELRQVRDAASRLRLRPVRMLFDVLERTSRDVARADGKLVAFRASGGDVRLDAHVLAGLQTALVQIVRNAIAHGIERGPARAAAGKASEGLISLDVARHGNRVRFTCRDDGRGIDVEGLRAAARRKGVAADAREVGPTELLRLLVHSGVTTAPVVTELSGRGVGLDVVRETAARLGGTLSVETEPGRGTVFTIDVPVSLAALDGLVVEAGGQMAVVPLAAVRATLRVGAGDMAKTADAASVVLGDKVVPFAPLAGSLRRQSNASRADRNRSAVVIEHEGAFAALGVDRLVRTENVVVRPLPRLASIDAVVSGASLDGDGNPQLVLDPRALLEQVRRPRASATVTERQADPILVVDDSLTTRMLEQSILEAAGYEVDVAVSGEDGLEKAGRRRYALFLVDVEMPGIDGFEFISRIRADDALKHTPAILVTSRNSPEDRQRGVLVGAKGHIVKSEFDQAELLARIRALVGAG